MSFQSTQSLRDHQEKEPLLAPSPNASYLSSEAEEYPYESSGGSSPTASIHDEQKPSAPRVMNLEFGPLEQPRNLQQHVLADYDRKLREAFEELVIERGVYHDAKQIYNNTIDEINSLVRQYNDERKKAPIYPPNGTWFQAERRLFSQKKAEHMEKLVLILRLKQAMIDDEEPKAREQLSKAEDDVAHAQAKLDMVRRGHKLIGI